MESTDWLPFFHLFQAVKALHLSGGVAAYIVSALEDTTDGDGRRSFSSARLDMDRRGRKRGLRQASGIHKEIPLIAPALRSPCNRRGHGR
jgi:hypothetical protein